VLAEVPYAEFMGDINSVYCSDPVKYLYAGCLYNSHMNPYMPQNQKQTLDIDFSYLDQWILNSLNSTGIPQITVLLSGRPMNIQKFFNTSQSFIAAFLPGTEGGIAIADAITGKYLFRSG